jgi:hypothetical protein
LSLRQFFSAKFGYIPTDVMVSFGLINIQDSRFFERLEEYLERKKLKEGKNPFENEHKNYELKQDIQKLIDLFTFEASNSDVISQLCSFFILEFVVQTYGKEILQLNEINPNIKENIDQVSDSLLYYEEMKTFQLYLKEGHHQWVIPQGLHYYCQHVHPGKHKDKETVSKEISAISSYTKILSSKHHHILENDDFDQSWYFMGKSSRKVRSNLEFIVEHELYKIKTNVHPV